MLQKYFWNLILWLTLSCTFVCFKKFEMVLSEHAKQNMLKAQVLYESPQVWHDIVHTRNPPPPFQPPSKCFDQKNVWT